MSGLIIASPKWFHLQCVVRPPRGYVVYSIGLFCGILHHIFLCFLGGLLMSPVSPFKNSHTNPAPTERDDLCDLFLYSIQGVSLGPNCANSGGASTVLLLSWVQVEVLNISVGTCSLLFPNHSMNFKMIAKLAIISR